MKAIPEIIMKLMTLYSSLHREAQIGSEQVISWLLYVLCYLASA